MQPLIYIGADDFSAAILKEICANKRVDFAAVVTYPDIPHGRGHKLIPTPVKLAAQGLGLPIVEIADVADAKAHEILRSFSAPAAILVSFKIVPVEFLRAFPRGVINLHPSMLPDLRGAAPVQWAIMLGYAKTGITAFVVSEQLDAGEILLQQEFPIGQDENAGEHFDKIVRPGAQLLINAAEGYLDGKIAPIPQSGEAIHRAPRILHKHRAIKWEWEAQRIHNRIRGLSPNPGAITMLAGKIVKLLRSRRADIAGSAEAGKIVDISANGIVVGTGGGFVAIAELQPEGRPMMNALDFARGYIKKRDLRFENVDQASYSR